jgi:hypothetical protein
MSRIAVIVCCKRLHVASNSSYHTSILQKHNNKLMGSVGKRVSAKDHRSLADELGG